MKITLSPPGVRPVWLKNDDVVLVRWQGGHLRASNPLCADKVGWKYADSIEIPDDHPYALGQKHGFEWRDPAASDVAPEDWDAGEVLFRNGAFGYGQRWGLLEGKEHYDIVGYRKRGCKGPGNKSSNESASNTPPASDWELGKEDCDGNELVTIRADELAALREAASRAPAKEVVDPELIEAREIAARIYADLGFSVAAEEAVRGEKDHTIEVRCALAGIKHGRETWT